MEIDRGSAGSLVHLSIDTCESFSVTAVFQSIGNTAVGSDSPRKKVWKEDLEPWPMPSDPQKHDSDYFCDTHNPQSKGHHVLPQWHGLSRFSNEMTAFRRREVREGKEKQATGYQESSD